MKQKKRNSKGFRKEWGYLREDKPIELSGENIEGRRVDFPKEANVFSNKPMPKITLDLKKIQKKFDHLFETETEQSFNEWLVEKRKNEDKNVEFPNTPIKDFVDDFYSHYGKMMSKLSRE